MGSGWAWLYFWGVGGVWEIGDFRENAQKWSFFRARCRSMGAFFAKKLPIYILFKYTPPPHPPHPHHPTHPHHTRHDPPTPRKEKKDFPNNISRILFINIFYFIKYYLLLKLFYSFNYPHAHRYTPGSAPRIIPKDNARAPSSPQEA